MVLDLPDAGAALFGTEFERTNQGIRWVGLTQQEPGEGVVLPSGLTTGCLNTIFPMIKSSPLKPVAMFLRSNTDDCERAQLPTNLLVSRGAK